MKVFIYPLLLLFQLHVLGQDWLMDLEKAKQEADETGKNIVLVFKGSDWCAPCMKLEREILDTEDFKTYASDHFILLEADFPRKRANKLSAEQQEKNNQLAERYNRNGFFPFVVVLNADGKVLGQTGYQKMPPLEFAKLIASF